MKIADDQLVRIHNAQYLIQQAHHLIEGLVEEMPEEEYPGISERLVKAEKGLFLVLVDNLNVIAHDAYHSKGEN